MTEPENNRSAEYAAVDLGSNSFHMVVSRIDNSVQTVIDRVREMVQLGSGLDNKNRLDEDAIVRALDCLTRFGERLRGMDPENVRIVGTNTLRKARNAASFIRRAEEALGFPIEIISGIEEARLIYHGVSQTLQGDRGRRLVVDIGGGSTEMIVGDSALPIYMESLYMGCVSTSKKFFGDGKISRSRMRKAIMAANVELEPHVAHFIRLEWVDVIGTSGTARSIERVICESGWSEGGITRAGMEQLVEAIVEARAVADLKLPGLGDRRRPVFAGGVAVLMAIFRSLSIDRMRISDGSLREGVLADLIGRSQSRDTRAETVTEMIKRHHIDEFQAQRVTATANELFLQVREAWGFKARDRQLLIWAAQLHEIGLMVAHNQYHKHGAYLLENMDLAGFSRQEQRALSVLVRLHRRKYRPSVLEQFEADEQQNLARLALLLRLAVVFNRGRKQEELPLIPITVDDENIVIALNKDWINEHALTQADLEDEQSFLKRSTFTLHVRVGDD
ncbi:MAG TPA: exopolyphosphatase [Gammaproteobacteria bacterium]|jgi:exopolyphosphatase/guanosine-5'-triphosphate,3'-diphosphate pyrophosphatase